MSYFEIARKVAKYDESETDFSFYAPKLRCMVNLYLRTTRQVF